MQENSVLYVTSDILRGGGSSWRIYRAVIEKKPVVLIARDTIAKMFKVSVTEVQKFIISYNFPTFEARLKPANKSKQKTLTLLSTAVEYWKYLYKRKQLTHLHSRTDERWKKFMAYCETLKCAEASQEQEPIQVPEYNCTPNDNFELIQSSRLFECFIESVGILSVVVDRWGKYWISPQSGLSVINAPAEWLNKELQRSAKRNRILQQRGFSGKYYQHLCKAPHGHVCHLTTLSFEDWLTIWAYFALQKNQKALVLLKLLAQKDIMSFLAL